MNKAIIEYADKIIEVLDNKKDKIAFIQFRSCKAYIGEEVTIQVDSDTFEDYSVRVVPIMSYDTIVGFADITNQTVYEYGKYTPTTSKQFTQIYNKRFSNYDRVLVDVPTYNRFVKKDWGC